MSIKVSNSSLDVYRTCKKKYDLQYNQKIVSKFKNSSLVFGSAFDSALNDVLLNHKKLSNEKLIALGQKTFSEHWEKQIDRNFGEFSIPKNPDISYLKKDYDLDLLIDEDDKLIQNYVDELKLQNSNKVLDSIRNNLFNFENFSEKERSFYNYINWLSLKRKADLMISSYVEELLPNISEIISVQKELSTQDEDGNLLTGVADFVVKLKTGVYGDCEVSSKEPIIADNKTASLKYKLDSVEKSEQLAKYKVILNEQEMPIKKGAYFVVLKDIKKINNKTCKSCGHKSISSHTSCNNLIGKKRCGGGWASEITFKAQTQIVVQDIPQDFSEFAMSEVDKMIDSIKTGNFEESWNKCDFQFGKPCQYKGYCQEGSMQNLIRVEKNNVK